MSDNQSLVEVPLIVRDARAGGFVRVNRTFREQVGFDSAALAANSLDHWIHPEDRDGLQSVLDQGVGCVQARHRAIDENWVSFDWQVKREERGPVVLGKLHREQRRDITDPLVGARERDPMGQILDSMALLVESWHPGMKCSVLLLDSEGNRIIVGAGPSLSEEYNSAVEGLQIGPFVGSCGTAAYWNQRVIVEDIQRDPLWRDLKDHAVKAGLASCWSNPITTRDGLVLGAMALYNPQPRVPTRQELNGLETTARLFGLAIERGRAEQALCESEEQVHHLAKMEALGVLAGGLAHDLNNILSIIMGNAELGKSAAVPGDAIHEALGKITTASRSASDLCNKMLAYAGRSTLTIEPLECNMLLQEFGELLQVTVSKKTSLTLDLCGDALVIEADRAQLGQVILNLVTNAAEAIGNEPGTIVLGTKKLECTEDDLSGFKPLSSLSPGAYARISVKDDGGGMTEAIQENIFDPFFSTKFSGRGLGLAAVHGIINRHRGGIKLDSVRGEGTTFTLLLPLVSRARIDNGKAGDSPVARLADGQRILVVDDEPEVRFVLGKILERAGFEVVLAEDGGTAITRYREAPDSIDCVLLDLNMPGLDGRETLQELRRIHPDVRVVLNSGFTEKEIIDRFEGTGFAEVLHKPAPAALLVQKILKALV